MTQESKLNADQLKAALQSETKRFEECYLWLEKSMPNVFFREVSLDWISLIVHNLMGFKEQDYFSEIHLKGAAIVLCSDTPEADLQILKRYPLYGIKNYTTYISRSPWTFEEKEHNLRIATLYFTDFDSIEPPLEQESILSIKKELSINNPTWGEEKLASLINSMDARFLRKLPEENKALTLELFEKAKWNDPCQYEIKYDKEWHQKNVPSTTILFAWRNVPKHNFLYRLARVVYRHNLIMQRVDAAYLNPYSVDSVLMFSFGLHGANGEAAWEAADINDFLQELVSLKYFGSADLIDATFVETKLLTGNQANLLRSLMQFTHQVLVHVDPNLYSLENVEEGLCRHPELTVKLCEAFACRLHPNQTDPQRFEELHKELSHLVSLLDTGHETQDIRRKNVLLQGLNFVSHTLKTNFYLPNKTAFSFRLDPNYLEQTPFERSKLFPELPFAIFFFKGMHFLGFHIRFKDLARGGLRTVFPERREGMLVERNTVFSECYHLAYTQHKKNKDIPEGGAKGVIFLKPYERLEAEAAILSRELHHLTRESLEVEIARFKAEQKMAYLYQTQRAYIQSFLSILNCDPDGTLREKNIVDYWQKPEYIYLGPDENLHDSMIEWIAQESKKVNYKPAGAFISGKPKIGINHKEHGVTSLGVNVYMEKMLYYLGIDPKKESFTVKMTGGPDGDVAGNQIFNLFRFYPNTAKLIALTDVSGTIYDPQGLDLTTCVRLFHESKSIRYYPPEKLNKEGFLLDRTERRELNPYTQQTLLWKNKDGSAVAEWISGNEMNALFRNNVHHAQADLFLPCGGRPRTLNEKNYHDFLDATGQPSSKAIIEGANLYLTPWARHYLEEKGVLIIKDSSANKGGVICSSFEILCGLTLTEEEFLKHKPTLVKQILVRLEKCASEEANLLLHTHELTKKPLTEISDAISKNILLFTDELLNYLEQIPLSKDPQDLLIKCFFSYCLPLLKENFKERLLKEIPENHKKAIIACHIASRLVYFRGLDWRPTLVDILPLILQDEELLITK